jgi:tRNA pseudouridine55 synthase
VKRRGRPITGILLLDKPLGLTSNAALQTVKRIFFAAKAGHTGSLDPAATGVLPICFGEATKFSQYLLDADKIYTCTVVFGVTTTTGDAEGEIVSETDASHLDETTVLEKLPLFRGDIKQVPSMYSALKKDGKPLYELARQGIEVEREARDITIFELRMEAFRPALNNESGRAEADLYVHCSKGTYIRSLAEDLGKALGVGAHINQLRRVKAGPFSIENSVTLEQLETLRQKEAFEELDAFLRPITEAVDGIPAVILGESTAHYFKQGQPVIVPKAPTNGLVAVSQHDGVFLGVGEILDDGRVAPKRLVVL